MFQQGAEAPCKRGQKLSQSTLELPLDVIEAVKEEKDVLVPKYTLGGDDDEKDN